jgi:hypothetical protein
MRRRTGEDSVSVIVGTLLLILITVTAAAGLALMVSQIQKDEMNRQSHLNAVKNENVNILNVAFENNQSEWELAGVKNSQNWSSVKLTLVNLNTDDVKILGIAINGHYALNFTDKSRTDSSVLSRTIFNSTNYLSIPATKSQDVYIDFVANASDDPSGFVDYSGAQYFGVRNSQNIRIGTSLTNFFEKTLKPPVPLSQIKIETDDLGTVKRDALVLDGSQSSADNTVVSWNWTVYDAAFTVPQGNWSDDVNWSVHNQTYPGKIVRVNLPNNTPYYRVTLTVWDNIGMSATSDPIGIPQGEFNPPTNLQLAINSPATQVVPASPTVQYNSTYSAQLLDINNHPVPNNVVSFIVDSNPNTPQNCFSIDSMANVTDSNGVALFTVIQRNATPGPSPASTPLCPQPITVHAQAGKLSSSTILVPGISALY